MSSATSVADVEHHAEREALDERVVPAEQGRDDDQVPELEIGRNSVSPWTIPRTMQRWNTMSIVTRLGYGRCGRWAPPSRRMNSGARTSVIVARSLTRTCSDGPAVSLNGSPTVSPTTAAAWARSPCR